MSKKEESIKVDLQEENVQEYEKLVNKLKNDVDKLKVIKKKKKKIQRLEKEKKEIIKKISKKH